MNKEIQILELFSGIGGFTKGLEQSGFTVSNHWFSEVNPHAIANYKYNFKNAENVGSVIDLRGEGITPTIITFGSPCQDFSLAGTRAGLDGSRSVLIVEAIRLIKELRPSVFIWENVKGTFSSNAGRDFWAILSAFANIGGYRLEWQLLNTSWFLPQNRERIYLVGHLGGRSEPGVFPITESNRLANKSFGEKATAGSWVQVSSHRNASALNTRYGKNGVDDNYIKITSNTKAGFEKAGIGDGIRFDHLVDGATGRARVQKKVAHTLDLSGTQGVLLDEGIRKFTEIEEERLQGFPDNWTKYGIYDGVVKEISKTQRYSLLGNAVTVNVVEEIGRRIKIN